MMAKIVMIDEQHCEMQDVVAKVEVKQLYDHVVENNIPFYRAVTAAKSGKKRYYFDEEKGAPVTAVNQEWFENPHYQAPVEETVVEEETYEEVEQERDELNNEVVEWQEKYDALLEKYEALKKEYLALKSKTDIVKKFFKGE